MSIKEELISFKNYLMKLLDKEDTTSMSRFLALSVVGVILYVWVIACLWTRSIVNIPDGVNTFALIVIGGKVVQSFGEVKDKLKALTK